MNGLEGLARAWFGDVDDLWKLGKPRGQGGPWRNSPVEAGQPTDPYLMTGYDRKTMKLSHDADQVVQFTVEVDAAVQGGFDVAFDMTLGTAEPDDSRT